MKGYLQLLKCDLSDLKAWLCYRDAEDGESAVEFEVACAHAEEQAEFLSKHGKRKPNDDEWRDYWLGHILDWRGIEDGGKPVEFDLDLLRVLWKRDAQFRAWLMTECQRLDRFRK
jgi:hypothetical protein